MEKELFSRIENPLLKEKLGILRGVRAEAMCVMVWASVCVEDE